MGSLFPFIGSEDKTHLCSCADAISTFCKVFMLRLPLRPTQRVIHYSSGVKRRREDSSDEAEKSQVAVTPSRPRNAKRKRQSSPFRRVRTEEIELFTCKDGKQLDNRMAVDVVGGVVGWGKKAHEQLKTVKGKKFTVKGLQRIRFDQIFSMKRTRKSEEATQEVRSIRL